MKSTNTVPYTNAAREGRTHHGLIEIRDPAEQRRRQQPTYANRARRRAAGAYIGFLRPAIVQWRSLRTIGQHPSQAGDHE